LFIYTLKKLNQDLLFISYFFTKVLEITADSKGVSTMVKDPMKYNKIISITLANGFILLVFASLLASCQKNSLKYQGHYTNYTAGSRAPASSDKIKDHFDPKQIFIYCKIHSVNVEQCFKQYFNDKLSELTKAKKLKPQDIQGINYKKYYSSAQGRVGFITKEIINQLDNNINYFVSKKEEFCAKNSKFHMEKCLKGTAEADSMHVLNSYQQTAPELNGHEYLHLKHHIKVSMLGKLDNSLNALKHLEKKKIDNSFYQLKKKLFKSLDKKKEWLQKVTSLPQAVVECGKILKSQYKIKSQYFAQDEIHNQWVEQGICMDYLKRPDVMEVVDKQYNQYFEEKLDSLYSHIKSNADDYVNDCEQKIAGVISHDHRQKKLQNCLKNTWGQLLQGTFDGWIQKDDNIQFASQKGLIYQRVENMAPVLRREIASEATK
jgi:hypothetical protein